MGSCPAPQPSSPPSSLRSFTRHLSCSTGLNVRTFPFQETEIRTKISFSFQIPCKAAFFHLMPQITVSEAHRHTEPLCRPTSSLTSCKVCEPGWLLTHRAVGHRCPCPLQCPSLLSLQEKGGHHCDPGTTLIPLTSALKPCFGAPLKGVTWYIHCWGTHTQLFHRGKHPL